MKTLSRSKIESLRRPSNTRIFKDNSENWLAFRKVRYEAAGDGDYALLYSLDLSRYALEDFPVDHLAFSQCNLDGASFKDTNFQFGTAFIHCSMQNIDLTETLAADALFLGCDLTGAKISTKKPYAQWTSQDMDGKDIQTVFVDCKVDATTEDWLRENKCIVSRIEHQSDNTWVENIEARLERIDTASKLKV